MNVRKFIWAFITFAKTADSVFATGVSNYLPSRAIKNSRKRRRQAPTGSNALSVIGPRRVDGNGRRPGNRIAIAAARERRRLKLRGRLDELEQLPRSGGIVRHGGGRGGGG